MRKEDENLFLTLLLFSHLAILNKVKLLRKSYENNMAEELAKYKGGEIMATKLGFFAKQTLTVPSQMGSSYKMRRQPSIPKVLEQLLGKPGKPKTITLDGRKISLLEAQIVETEFSIKLKVGKKPKGANDVGKIMPYGTLYCDALDAICLEFASALIKAAKPGYTLSFGAYRLTLDESETKSESNERGSFEVLVAGELSSLESA